MNPSTFKFEINVLCSINPSEDPKKIKVAISNIFPNLQIITQEFTIVGKSRDLSTLEFFFDSIQSLQSQRIYKRTLEKNKENNATWFYLNKQAAFANKIAICEESNESPLGPIKVILTSNNIERVVDLLC